MEEIDYWMLNEEFSVHETILLSLGVVPNNKSWEVERMVASRKPQGYDALRKLLLNKIKSDQLKSKIEYTVSNDFEGTTSINLDETTIDRVDIKNLFGEIGFKPSFFFSQDTEERGYMDQNHPYYAPKLSAAVTAWEAITNDPLLLNGKTPKKALEKWLRENASDFGLTKEDGSPNESGIEEISKIANWRPEGGAARTPTQVPKNPTTPKKLVKKPLLNILTVSPPRG